MAVDLAELKRMIEAALPGAAVEIADEDGSVFAKGLCRYSSLILQSYKGCQTAELPTGFPDEVIHRDDLVVLPAPKTP